MILKNPYRFEAAETIFESDESKKTNKQFYILIHLNELENLCTFNSLLTLHLDLSEFTKVSRFLSLLTSQKLLSL